MLRALRLSAKRRKPRFKKEKPFFGKGFFCIENKMVIVSKNNPFVKEISSLKDKKGRKERGTFLVEGEKMVRECVESGLFVKNIFLREEKADLKEWASEHAAGVTVFGADAFGAISDAKTPQGIAAEVTIPLHSPEPPETRCLLLDGVSDPANVGAIVRTAVAAGYRELYLADCADPYSPKSVRSSMSGVFFAKLMQGSVGEILEALRNVPIVAADMGGEDVFSFVPPGKFCIAIGNEGNGLSETVRSRAEFTVGIPMERPTESLNAAVSAGIMMYALRQQRK